MKPKANVNFNPPKLSQHDEFTARRMFGDDFMVLRFAKNGNTDVYEFSSHKAGDLIDSLKRFIVSIITVPGLLYTHEDITCGDDDAQAQREADIMHAYGVIERWRSADADKDNSPIAQVAAQANDETKSRGAAQLQMALTNVIYQSDAPVEFQMALQHVIHQELCKAAYDAAIQSIDPRWT